MQQARGARHVGACSAGSSERPSDTVGAHTNAPNRGPQGRENHVALLYADVSEKLRTRLNFGLNSNKLTLSEIGTLDQNHHPEFSEMFSKQNSIL